MRSSFNPELKGNGYRKASVFIQGGNFPKADIGDAWAQIPGEVVQAGMFSRTQAFIALEPPNPGMSVQQRAHRRASISLPKIAGSNGPRSVPIPRNGSQGLSSGSFSGRSFATILPRFRISTGSRVEWT